MGKLYQTGTAILIAILLIAGAYSYRSHTLQENIAKEILRFHVIANSNTKEDQELKLKVRDRIGTYLQDKLTGAENLAECEQIVKEHVSQLENCAQEVIAEEGYDYTVDAALEDADFPVKTYGSYTFPKGKYRALKVAIGEGKGENWWCVMYPNLCFANSVYEIIDEKSKEKLEEVLKTEDYAEIMAEGEIKVKFKYLEALLP